jgi:hypothetical protein
MGCHPREEIGSEHVSGTSGLAGVPGGSTIRDGVDGATGALRPRGNVRVRPNLSRPKPGKRFREIGLLDQPDDPRLAQPEHVDQLGHRHHHRLPVGHAPDTTYSV